MNVARSFTRSRKSPNVAARWTPYLSGNTYRRTFLASTDATILVLHIISQRWSRNFTGPESISTVVPVCTNTSLVRTLTCHMVTGSPGG